MHKRHFSKLLITIALMLYSCVSYSQIIGRDYGLFLGTSQYNGDVNMTKAYSSPHFTIALWHKLIYNSHYSVRFAITYGELKNSDKNFASISPYQQARSYEFSDHNLYEFSGLLEYNFYPITVDEDEDNFTPYVVGGPAIFFTDNLKWYEVLCFPIGVGLKYRLTSRLEIDTEWVFRKTFTDKLDGLDSYAEGGFNHLKQQSFDSTKDWYSLLGVTIVISFMNPQGTCPVYKEKKEYELINKSHRKYNR